MSSITQAVAFIVIAAITTTSNILIRENLPKQSDIPKVDEVVVTEKPKELSPEDADGVFSIAIIPDTQQEVTSKEAINKKLFLNRSEWLVDQKDELDLRCVIHTGDIVNWGNEEPYQFEIASEAMSYIAKADIPVVLSLGNHDTAAVGVGGSAKDPPNTSKRVRDTESFNEYFPIDEYEGLVAFEEGKVDNSYLRFNAAGKKWLVMSLELWPREEVIDWAEFVIQNRPDYNVIISTHSYLTSDGKIYNKNGGYGATSPEYLYNNLIKKYENIKFIFSGHTGSSLYRADIGDNSNTVISMLGGFHSSTSNPVKIVTVDVKNGKISGYVYSPYDNAKWTHYDFEISGLSFVGE